MEKRGIFKKIREAGFLDSDFWLARSKEVNKENCQIFIKCHVDPINGDVYRQLILTREFTFKFQKDEIFSSEVTCDISLSGFLNKNNVLTNVVGIRSDLLLDEGRWVWMNILDDTTTAIALHEIINDFINANDLRNCKVTFHDLSI